MEADQESKKRIKTDEAPQLSAVLREMKKVLEEVTSRVQSLIAKVKANAYPTADGMSYLEAKNLLLINYCQSLVYSVLRKAKGLSIENHPVVQSLVETRLFLEKIRPIDKKLEYQIEKLIKDASRPLDVKESKTNDAEDPLNFHPNPDNMLTIEKPEEIPGVPTPYRIPKIGATKMEDDDKKTRETRNAFRKEKDIDRRSRHGITKEIFDELQGKPEEIRESFGHESREFEKYQRHWEEREKQEEEMFTRGNISKAEKKQLRQLRKSRGGLGGLTDDFYDDVKSLAMDEGGGREERISGRGRGRGMGKRKKRKMY
ncbi:NGDN [Linum perenne]